MTPAAGTFPRFTFGPILVIMCVCSAVVGASNSRLSTAMPACSTYFGWTELPGQSAASIQVVARQPFDPDAPEQSAAIPLMKGRPGAMISSVASTGGRYGVEGWSVYCATKFAVNGLHDALRKELGLEGIRVSVIEPGAVWTEFGHNVPQEALQERREILDALTAEDVAQALVYAFAQHPRVLVEEILVRPVKQVAP